MDKDLQNNVSTFFKIIKNIDDTYVDVQKLCGLPDGEFWCLFAVVEEKCQYQHEICETMYMNKQTVNSALKGLIRKGILAFVVPEENQRVKRIKVTEAGSAFVKKHFDPVNEVEKEIWDGLSINEQEQLLLLLDKLANGFEEKFAKYVADKRKEIQ